MSEYDDTTYNLIPFFRKLADDIENNNLTMAQLFTAGQMYMKYQFENNPETEEISEEKAQEYLCTGWYINTCIRSNLSNPQQN